MFREGENLGHSGSKLVFISVWQWVYCRVVEQCFSPVTPGVSLCMCGREKIKLYCVLSQFGQVFFS